MLLLGYSKSAIFHHQHFYKPPPDIKLEVILPTSPRPPGEEYF